MDTNELKPENENPIIKENEIIDNFEEESAAPQVEPSFRHPRFHFFLLIIGILTLVLGGSAISATLKALNVSGVLYHSLSNLLIYVLVFGVLILSIFLFRLLKPIAKEYTKAKPYIYGVFYGFIIIIASVTYGLFSSLIAPDTTSNINQTSIEEIILNYPVSSFFWIVFIGPLVEEIIYRLGLFEGLRQKSRIAAYIVSGIIFGFIHFNIPFTTAGEVDTLQLINEFINVPSYIISGLLFAYTYEKIGFAGSSVAHITNNLISFIFTIIRIYAK